MCDLTFRMSRDILENVTKETKTVTRGIWFKGKNYYIAISQYLKTLG